MGFQTRDPIFRRRGPVGGATLDIDFFNNTSSLTYSVTAYDPDAQAVINAMNPAPSPARAFLIHQTITSLKQESLWAKLDFLYCFAAHAEAPAWVNWRNPALYNLTKVGAPTFAANRGYTNITGPANNVLTSGYNPSTAGGVYTQNSAHLGGFTITAGASPQSGEMIGTSNSIFVQPWSIGVSTGRIRVNSNTSTNHEVFSTPTGHFIALRRDAANQIVWKDGTSSSVAAVSVAVPNAPLGILNRNLIDQPWRNEVAWVHGGSQLSDAECTALNTILSNYNMAVGIVAADPATAVILAMEVPPLLARQTVIRNLVNALITAGSWAKMDLLYVLCAHHEQAARLNWKNPAKYLLGYVGTTGPNTFTVDRGFTGQGVSTSYLNTGWNALVDAVNLQRDSVHWGVIATTEKSDTGEDFSASGNLFCQTRSTLSNGTFRLNTGTSTAVYTMTSAFTHIIGIRRDSAQQISVVDGLVFPPVASVSTAVATGIALIGTRSSAASTRQVAVVHNGGALADAEAIATYNAVLAYRTAVGCIPNPVQMALAAMTVQPDAGRTTLYTNLINSLVSAGLWDKLDMLYILAAHDEQASRLNLRYPGAFTAPNTAGPPIFTVDRGWEGNGTNAAMNIGWSPNIMRQGSANGFTTNSATAGIWTQRANTINSSYDLYMATTLIWRGTNTVQFRINDAATRNFNAALPATGHYAVRRTTSTESSGWIGGVNITGSGATVSTTCASATVLFSTSAASWSNSRIAAYYAGGAFSDTQMAQMHTILSTWMTAVGA